MKKELPERAISWVVSLLRSLDIVITPEKEDLVRSSHLGVGALTEI